MPLNSYSETILNYFCTMNIDSLRLDLKDEYSYQDTRKEDFLEKLNEIFDEHKNAGDTDLKLYKGTCVDHNNYCGNCGKSGFRFVGNQSNNYLDLIFEIEEEDIKDIYYCSKFKTESDLQGLKSSSSIYIDIEDRNDFNHSFEHYAKVNEALAAVAEIVCSPAKTLNFDEICSWLEKHHTTYENIGGYSFLSLIMKWDNFLRLYHNLSEIKNYITTNNNQIIESTNNLKLAISEAQLIDWVIKNEALFDGAGLRLKHDCAEATGNFYYDNLPYNINLNGQILDNISHYIRAFQENYDLLYAKYRVYTLMEIIDIDNEREFKINDVDLSSLSFHLEARKKLESQGVNVPFYKVGK